MRAKAKRIFRSARLVRRAGQLYLVVPRAVWARIGVRVGDRVSVEWRDGRAVIARAKRAAKMRLAP